MKKSAKIIIVSVFAAVIISLGLVLRFMSGEPDAGTKEFTLNIVSERNSFDQTISCRSEAEYLGGFLRELDGLEYTETEYGIYITGYDGMAEDIPQQFWWCIMVGEESASAGADDIPLKDGGKYALVLTQGW